MVRMFRRQPTLGFINPALYTNGLASNFTADLHDLTSGSYGFNAPVGYGSATEWGQPDQPDRNNLINNLLDQYPGCMRLCCRSHL
jgi:hypothetical protein